MTKHIWTELLPRSNYPYPSYFCRKCGQFTSNHPQALQLGVNKWTEKCEGKVSTR